MPPRFPALRIEFEEALRLTRAAALTSGERMIIRRALADCYERMGRLHAALGRDTRLKVEQHRLV
jgi:hypothetical protein